MKSRLPLRHSNRILFPLMLFFSLFLSYSIIVAYQKRGEIFTISQSEAQESQNWQCLKAEEKDIHSVTIQAVRENQFVPPGTEVYIVECISTSEGDMCTTANPGVDTMLFGNTESLQYLQNEMEYRLVSYNGTQPEMSNEQGMIREVEWESLVEGEQYHTFYGVTLIEARTSQSGSDQSLKLGSFYFMNATDEECNANRWDPYGRAFDSKSLEPIKGTLVTLLKKRPSGEIGKLVLPGITNPQRTKEDGEFNFVVPDGTYLLSPSIASHTFPNKPPFLHPNYTQAYSDIYRGGDIVQIGFIQHRDIPLDPISSPYHAPAIIEDYSVRLDKVNAVLQINGSVSHPRSLLQVVHAGMLLEEVTTSAFGTFNTRLENAELQSENEIELRVVKIDLTTMRPAVADASNVHRSMPFSLIPPAVAQNNGATVVIHPIPNILKGFAYDTKGNVVPNASVSIFLTFSSQPFYRTEADGKGYFSIASQYLPPLSYNIQIKSPNGDIRWFTPVEFSQANKTFLSQNNIYLGAYTPEAVPGYSEISRTDGTSGQGYTDGTDPDGTQSNQTGQTGTDQNGGTGSAPDTKQAGRDEKQTENAMQKKQSVALLIVVLLCILTAGGGILLYLRIRKKLR